MNYLKLEIKKLKVSPGQRELYINGRYFTTSSKKGCDLISELTDKIIWKYFTPMSDKLDSNNQRKIDEFNGMF